MSRDLSQWHRHFVLVGVLDFVDEFGRPDTRELVICETVERRRHYQNGETEWQYRWPD